MSRRLSILTACCAALLLSSCVSQQDIDAASAVITALPQEVQGCVFVADVDATPRMVIHNARFDLKLQAARLGATHVVELFAYPAQMRPGWDFGVALSGRAYRCPEGLGPLMDNTEAALPSPELPPPPYINFGDDWPHH